MKITSFRFQDKIENWKVEKNVVSCFGKKHIANALALLENHTYKEVVEMTGISKSTLIRARKKRVKGND